MMKNNVAVKTAYRSDELRRLLQFHATYVYKGLFRDYMFEGPYFCFADNAVQKPLITVEKKGFLFIATTQGQGGRLAVIARSGAFDIFMERLADHADNLLLSKR